MNRLVITPEQNGQAAAALGVAKGSPLTSRKITDALTVLVAKAHAGDADAMNRIEAVMSVDFIPGMLGANLTQRVEMMIVDGLTKDQVYARALHQKLANLRGELLAGGQGTAMERLLAERVALSWLHLHRLEMEFESARTRGMSLAMSGSLQRAITMADRRYTSALRTLAMVRKLAAPILAKNVRITMSSRQDEAGEGGQSGRDCSAHVTAGRSDRSESCKNQGKSRVIA